MNYTIRPIGPEDAEGAAALRRMPGVFENTLGLPPTAPPTARRSSPGWALTTITLWPFWTTAR